MFGWLSLRRIRPTVLLAQLAIGLIGSEVLLRVFAGDEINLLPRYHSAVTYGDFTLRRIRPSTTFWHTTRDGSWKFVTNAQGFRNLGDIPYERTPAMRRVLAIGDSHTQGYEVDQDRTFAARVETLLRRRGPAEVLNAGVSGFGTAESLVFLENEGIKYRPDVVVLGFYQNDFDDNIKAGLFRLDDGKLVVARQKHTPGTGILGVINEFAVVRWLSENSRLYSVALNVAWETGKLVLLGFEQRRLETEFAVSEVQLDTYKVDLAVGLLARMHAFCRERGIPLIVVDIPRPLDGPDFRASVPPELVDRFRANSDRFISSDEALDRFRGVAQFHVPHGHRHISDFSHMILALEIEKAVVELHRPGAAK